MKENRLIVEFMGMKPKLISPDEYEWADAPYFAVTEDTPEKVMSAITNYVKYDTSWAWLMPCIDKIKGIDKDEFGRCDDIMDNMMMHLQRCDLDNTYISVIKFIKWYNKQKLCRKIDSGEIDTDDLKADFNEKLYALGYDTEMVWAYTDEHYENLLSDEENLIKFAKWYSEQK